MASPSHYTRGSINVWDFIRDQQLGFHRGNAIKYICRAGHKDNEIEDLEKAGVYTTHVGLSTIDEAPEAYKNSKIIEEAIKPTCVIIDRIIPVINLKSGDG